MSSPTICLLALSAIADDPRVRRQGDAFHRAGWNVVGIGLPGARSPQPEWRILVTAENNPAAPPSTRSMLKRLYHDGARRSLARRGLHAFCLLSVRLRPALAHPIYWASTAHLDQLQACARQVPADVWLANDWCTLPLAAQLARLSGGLYGYDSHEFATEEYADSRGWRWWRRPLVAALERAYIGSAAVISAVSPGIAAELDALYRPAGMKLVIRNTPAFEAVPFRPTGIPIRVLYQGLIAPGRGLEAMIDSVPLWRPHFDLTIRGPGNSAYLSSLRSHIEVRRLCNRIHLLPPVPMTALVRKAAEFDVGLFALPGTSLHNRFALPNKLFEYVMAGLAVCATDLPEMARLIRQHDLGVTFPTTEPAAIAEAVNALDPARVDAHKRNALVAARELCWESEGEQLVSAYEAALAGAS